MKKILLISFLFGTLSLTSIAQKPNVVFILTDDQGYGDLGCNGNPVIKTPNIDKLHAQSIRFTDYHVATTCAPTRAGLLTGKNCNKVGAWHTIIGRELLRKQEVTLAEVFKDAGYITGIFGKWHLGDSYPFRPQDRGFDEVLIHGGGGVAQTPDYWLNDYFDDTYFHNGTPEKFPGYCNDVWFGEAAKFISKNKKKPFFCFISTNSPHSPYNVADKYSDPYKNNPAVPVPNFYGMITNIDEQVGILIEKLKKEGQYENTIFVFMTDNGTAAGVKFDVTGELVSGFNAGMRATKGSPYDGGHRVPFILHWPKGGYNKGVDINSLTSYTDFMPTLIDLCKIPNRKKVKFDGVSLVPAINGNDKNLDNRVLVADVQRDEFLVKWKQSSVMTQQWRLVNETELYDIKKDKAQKVNVASENPDVVAKLKAAYEIWWKDVSQNGSEYNRVIIGSPFEKVTTLTAHDLHVEKDFPAWNQDMVRFGMGSNGFWALEVQKTGKYTIELRRYPQESGLPISAAAPKGEPVPGGRPYSPGVPLAIKKARIKAGTLQLEQEVKADDKGAIFSVSLKKGKLDLETFLQDETGKERGAYYVYISPAL